jgi:hypothetical protein
MSSGAAEAVPDDRRCAAVQIESRRVVEYVNGEMKDGIRGRRTGSIDLIIEAATQRLGRAAR